MVEYLSGNRTQGSSAADGDLGTGLKAYYKFNESSGNIVNVANTITGNSTLGTGQNITMNGDPTYSVTGTPSSFGNAVSCDGSGDYGQFGTKTDWNFLHTTGATWTINVWLKFDASVVANKQLFDNTQTADSTIGLNIRTQSSNRFRVIIPRGVGNSSTLDTDNNPNLPIPTDNAWHMYTFRWDQSSGNGVLTYNRDGANELTKNGSGNGTTTSDCTDSPRLFSQSNSVSGELDSEIAEMSIFNTVLTDAEVTRLYNSGSGRLLTKAGSSDEKTTLTNVPANSRYEETDTRKIFRRAILKDNCIAYYNFDSTTGGLVNQATTTNGFTDGLGSSTDGTVSGATTTTGKFSYCYDFDGTDDYVNLGTNSGLNLLNGGTIAMWINTDDMTNLRFFGMGTNKLELLSEDVTNFIKFRVSDGTVKNAVGDIAVPDSTWTHVAGTYDKDNGEIKLYVNGVLDATTTGVGQILTVTTAAYFGRNQGGQYFNGRIDDAGIWNVALSGDQISALYNSGTGKLINEAGVWKERGSA